MEVSMIAPEVLISRYEALREGILGSSDSFFAHSALNTLLRQGMLAWMRELQNCTNAGSRVETFLPTKPSNSAKQHAKAGSIIADMMLPVSKNNRHEGQYI